MIVRISTEGQYELDGGETGSLNELDNQAVEACEAGDEARFHEIYGRMLELIRTKGHAVAEDELTGSDLILPPPDVTLEEAREGFSGEGLLPG